MKCGDCGAPMKLRRSSKDGKMFLGCARYPACRGVHSVHQDTLKPMGIPGDKATREARHKAHKEFDYLWLNLGMSRPGCYRELAAHLGIPEERCHFSEFDLAMCAAAFKWAEARIKRREHEQKRIERQNRKEFRGPRRRR